jgi:hypothetical protein
LWYVNQPAECKSQCRSINNYANLNIFNYATESSSATLKFNTTGQPDKPVNLIVEYNDSFLDKISISKTDQAINLLLDSIPRGESQLTFMLEDEDGNIINDPSFIKIYNLSVSP